MNDILSLEFSFRELGNGSLAREISVTMSDLFSDASVISLLYWKEGEDQTWINLTRRNDGTFRNDDEVNRYLTSGAYAVRSIRATDDLGGDVRFNEENLGSLGFETRFTLENLQSDDVNPTVETLQVSDFYFDTIEQLWKIDYKIDASDDGSGLQSGHIVELTNPTGASLQDWRYFDENGIAEETLIFGKYISSGEYRINTIRIYDEAGNSGWIYSNDLVSFGQSATLQLDNSYADLSAPELSLFSFSAIADPVSLRPSIVISFDANDDGSGYSRAYVRLRDNDGFRIDRWVYSDSDPATDGIQLEIDLSNGSSPGRFSIDYLRLYDVADNVRTLQMADIVTLGFNPEINLYFAQNISTSQTIFGDVTDDWLFGTDQANELIASNGSDTIDGGGGNDTLMGGDGNDVLNGGDGVDVAVFASQFISAQISTHGGLLIISTRLDGADELVNIEVLEFADRVLQLTLGTDGSDRIGGFSNLASPLDDYMDGGSGNDEVRGWNGNDILRGGEGDDNVQGLDGGDVVYGDAGNDDLSGGLGDDTLYGGAGNDKMFGDEGSDQLYGGYGDDILRGSYYFSDTVETLDGDDLLSGGPGSDRIYGAYGSDTLIGGVGDDTLTGGAGSDRFVFSGVFDHDVITDFDETEDSLEFYTKDGSAIAVSELIDSADTNGHRVLSTSDGMSSVTFSNLDFYERYVNSSPVVESKFIGNGFTNVSPADAEFINITSDLSPTTTFFGSGTIFVQYAYSGLTPVAFAAYFGNEADDFSNWTSGRDISEFVTISGDKFDNEISVLAGAGIASSPFTISVSSKDPYYVYPWYGVGIDVGGELVISGSAEQGEILSVDTTLISDADGLGQFTFQWVRDGSEIDGANSSNYVLTQEDVDARIAVYVSYTDGGGTLETVTSIPTAPVGAGLVSQPAFDITLTSESNGTALFAIYANELVDPDNDGIGSFEFTLSHDPSDLLIDIDSFSSASGISGVPNYNAMTGTLEAAAFAFPNFTNLTAPIATFSATILDSENPLNMSLTDAIVDRVAQDDVVEPFDFSSVGLTVTTVDRFSNSLTPDEVVVYEVASGGQIYVREVGDSEDNTVFEIVASPTSEFSALDFDLTDYADLNDFVLSDALSTWTSQTNPTAPNQVAFSGFSNSGGIPAGQETVLATFTTAMDPDFDISGIELDGVAQPDVSVGEIPPAVSTDGNVTVFETARNSDTYIFADKDIDEASEDAIGAFDALQALRLAVGLTKSDGTADWHDYFAADINQDGRVGADDALNILKVAVGLTDVSAADWVFVDGDAEYSDVSRTNSGYTEGVFLDAVTVDKSVALVGILLGDVDGSYF